MYIYIYIISFVMCAVDATLHGIVAKKPNDIIPQKLLWELFTCMQKDGFTFEQGICSIWEKLVPPGIYNNLAIKFPQVFHVLDF